MPALFPRIALLCHLLNILLYFLPKKLSSLLLPSSLLRHKAPAAAAAAASSFSFQHCPLRPSSDHPEAPRSAPKAIRKEEVEEVSNMADESTTSPHGRQAMGSAELKRVFQMFDRNGDGRITKKELSDSLENLGIYIPEEDMTALIEKIDVNGDGCVDIDEFGTLYKMIMDERDEEEDMREAFDVFDQNGDGFITVDELRSVLVSLGLKQGRTVEDCRKMINKVDVDGDGMVNFKEFKQMMRGGGFAAMS